MTAATTIPQRLAALRQWMHNHSLGAFVIPSNDPHFSEYVAPHWGCRAWISGFDGSAGTVVVTAERAALWTDSRYFLQAETQLQGNGIELQRMGVAETPSLAEWLQQYLHANSVVGVDGALFSRAAFDQFQRELVEQQLELRVTDDPFDSIWEGRPPMPTETVVALSEHYSGESTAHKLARIRQQQPQDAVRIIAVLDEIAWTLNLRGGDIDYNPLFISYLAVEPQRAVLFVQPQKIASDTAKQLQEEADVEISPYEAFTEYLTTLGGKKVVVNPNGLDTRSWEALEHAEAHLIRESTPYGAVSAMKAVKNTTEIEGFRQAMERDGVALVRFERWLEEAVRSGARPTERQIAERLHAFRAAGEEFRGESFETIAGYGDHGAIVHYSVTPESDRPIDTESFLLIDSGGQYLCGTTDITRTYHFGRPTAEQRRDYTAVLKGMIDLSASQFPVGTRGAQLDVLARRYLWAQGDNYLHGTGHGIGHFLCVHEGPQSIRMNENPVVLEPGMVQSCEPGLYRAGSHGIRIENLILVSETDVPNGFLRLETLTLCPISTTALDIEALERPQREWLNSYHAEVYRRLAPLLTPDEQAWLRDKTRPV